VLTPQARGWNVLGAELWTDSESVSHLFTCVGG
jgi:hypothetical protein